MTTIVRTLYVDDGEFMMLYAALDLMIANCDAKKGNAPHEAWKHYALKVKADLRKNVEVASSYTPPQKPLFNDAD
jgi:uncharacterized protein YcgI (DUF1989 family)